MGAIVGRGEVAEGVGSAEGTAASMSALGGTVGWEVERRVSNSAASEQAQQAMVTAKSAVTLCAPGVNRLPTDRIETCTTVRIVIYTANASDLDARNSRSVTPFWSPGRKK